MNKETLLAEIRDTHEALEVALEGLTDTELLAESSDMPGWTRKDVLAHVAWWAEHSTGVIEALREGREPYDPSGPWDVDGHNARVLAENRDRTADEVRRWEAGTYRRVLEVVEQTSEEELFGLGHYPWLGDATLAETVRADISDHYRDHVSSFDAAGG